MNICHFERNCHLHSLLGVAGAGRASGKQSALCSQVWPAMALRLSSPTGRSGADGRQGSQGIWAADEMLASWDRAETIINACTPYRMIGTCKHVAQCKT